MKEYKLFAKGLLLMFLGAIIGIILSGDSLMNYILSLVLVVFGMIIDIKIPERFR